MHVRARHSFTSRLLYTIVPSEVYHGDNTLDKLHSALADDLLRMYNEGLNVACLWRIPLFCFES